MEGAKRGTNGTEQERDNRASGTGVHRSQDKSETTRTQQDNKRTIEKIRVIHIQNIRVEASHLGSGLQLGVSVQACCWLYTPLGFGSQGFDLGVRLAQISEGYRM